MPVKGRFNFNPQFWWASRIGEIEVAFGVIIAEAVDNMKHFIETRPSLKSGKPGRVESGDMLKDVAGEVFYDGVGGMVGKFGFLNVQELYYALQTSTGFTHYKSGEFIEPTFAMRDAQVIAILQLIESMKKGFSK